MSWGNKNPAHKDAELPQAIVDFIWERDEGFCQLRYDGECTVLGQEIDHIRGIAELGYRDDRPDNLRLVCCACHKLRTQQQRWPVQARRITERHPGVKWERISNATQGKASGSARGTQSRAGRSISGPTSFNAEVRARPRVPTDPE